LERSPRPIVVFLAVVMGVVVFRGLYDLLPLERLGWLLRPTAWGVSVLTGAQGSEQATGIAFPALGVLLDRSCAGGHFALMLAGFMVYSMRGRLKGLWRSTLLVLISLAVSIPITIIGNVQRVWLSIMSVRLDPTHRIGHTDHMHLFIGALVQVFLLILIHVLINRPRRAQLLRPA
jgi:exosortase K